MEPDTDSWIMQPGNTVLVLPMTIHLLMEIWVVRSSCTINDIAALQTFFQLQRSRQYLHNCRQWPCSSTALQPMNALEEVFTSIWVKKYGQGICVPCGTKDQDHFLEIWNAFTECIHKTFGDGRYLSYCLSVMMCEHAIGLWWFLPCLWKGKRLQEWDKWHLVSLPALPIPSFLQMEGAQLECPSHSFSFTNSQVNERVN